MAWSLLYFLSFFLFFITAYEHYRLDCNGMEFTVFPVIYFCSLLQPMSPVDWTVMAWSYLYFLSFFFWFFITAYEPCRLACNGMVFTVFSVILFILNYSL